MGMQLAKVKSASLIWPKFYSV